MPSTKPLEDASQDFAADMAALRDDIAKLTASMATLAQAMASAGAETGAIDRAARKLFKGPQERAGAAASDLEAAIERNPLTAVVVALAAGVLIGMLSRGRR